MSLKKTVCHFRINNMACVSCVDPIKKHLMTHLPLEEVHVNVADKTVSVSGSVDKEKVISCLKKAGFDAESIDSNALDSPQKFEQTLLIKTGVSMVFAIPLMIDMFFPFIPPLDSVHGPAIYLTIGILCFFILSYTGGMIYRSAYNAFIHHQANMDTLVALGTGAAWLYSMLIILFHLTLKLSTKNLYFESAIVIIAFINLGAFLENRAKSKSSDAIRKLIALQPKQATRIKDDKEQLIPLEKIQKGDVIKVYPGEKIPVDGLIIQGESRIDESMLTGEPQTVKKSIDERVYAGTINGLGSFLFKATRVGEHTALAQIITLVKQAQNTKPKISRLVDIIAHYFVPTVLIVAVITALCWFNLKFPPGMVLTATLSVLIIACPCALGLATPIATTVGIGKSAQAGILIKNGESLQTLSHLSDIVFDKTGTLTQAKPAVTHIQAANGSNNDELLRHALSLESNSEHPIARAIIDYAQTKNIQAMKSKQFNAIEGKGAYAEINDRRCFIGNPLLFDEYRIDYTPCKKDITRLEHQGNTVVMVALDNTLLGYIAINYPTKPEAKKTIETLRELGLTTHLFSGDNERTVHLIAKKLNLHHARGNLLPKDKLDLIRRLKTQKNKIAMVGDGINDAPALALADVGIAIGTGTDVAIESADVVIMKDSLLSIAESILISKATMRTIKQNLVGAFLYNIIGIPIATGLLYPVSGLLLNPMIAGAAMAASSLTVVVNANRLRFANTS